MIWGLLVILCYIVIGDLASLASVRQRIVTDGFRAQTCPHQRTLWNSSLQPITRCEPKTSFD